MVSLIVNNDLQGVASLMPNSLELFIVNDVCKDLAKGSVPEDHFMIRHHTVEPTIDVPNRTMEVGLSRLLGPLGQLSRKTESSSKLPKQPERRCKPMFPALVTTR